MASIRHSFQAFAVACATLATGTPGRAQVQFFDATALAGVGNQLYETNTNHGGGAAWIDVDHDGYPDLFLVNGKGLAPHLYLNNGNGTFSQRDDLLPVLPDVEMPGAVFGDYDNDGDSDLFILTDNQTNILSGLPNGNPQDGPPDLLLKNLWVESGHQLPPPGQPLFQEVAAAAGVADLPPAPFPSVFGTNYPGYRSITASFVDIDRDGWLDLFIGHWSCANNFKKSNWNRLYRNNGNGTFSEATVASGLPADTVTSYLRPELASIGAHLDQDLWPDLFWGKVQCGVQGNSSQDSHWRNTGAGRFSDATSASPGVGDDTTANMGIAVGDIDLDGDWDIYMTDVTTGVFETPPFGNCLYLNQGNGTFADNSALAAGVDAYPSSSWPANLLDVDRDGYEDLFVGIFGAPAPGANKLYMNNGNGTFTDVGPTANVFGTKNVQGAAAADYDRDGDVDLVVVSDENSQLQLLRNDSINGNHWLAVELAATLSNRDAIGSIIRVSAGGKQMMRQFTGGNSAHSQDALVAFFGLGGATSADSVEVLWPSGLVSRLTQVTADQYLTVAEAPQYFEAYGAACNGGGVYSPSLIMQGAATPGGAIALDIQSGFGGGTVLFVVGLPSAIPVNVSGCLLHVGAPLLVAFGGFLSGSNPGQGGYHLPTTIPATSPIASVAIQAFVVHASLPGMESATNAVKMNILP